MIRVTECITTMSTGGAETMVKDYCQLIDRSRFDMNVVVLDHRYQSGNEQILDDLGIRTEYLNEAAYGSRTDLNVIEKVVRTLVRFHAFRRVMLKEDPDIIHIHLLVGPYFALLPLKKMKCRLVMTIHNVFDNYFSTDRSAGRKYREYRRVYKLIHKHGMTLIALHESMRKELMQRFDTDRVITVNNGIDMSRFDPALYDRGVKRAELGIAEDEYVIGNVGRLHEQKNHALILDVAACLKNRGEKVRLLLIGKGPLYDDIRKKIEELGISEEVILLSNRSDVPELMSAMDVFLFPSRWEGYGNVLLEAQCMGLECVISDKVPECVRISDRIHTLSLEDEVTVWADEVIRYKDKNEANEYSANAEHSSFDPSDYDMKNCVKKIERVYEELCNDQQ